MKLASEEEVAAIVVAYLEALGADVYQEVEISGGVADIVAVVGAETSHRVWLAAPYTRNSRGVAGICHELGLGVLQVSKPADYGYGPDGRHPKVEILSEARRLCRRPVALTKKLRAEHKTHAKAGAVGAGGRWTPFRGTCESLLAIVKESPGIHLADAVKRTKHHYRSVRIATSSLTTWTQGGKVPGVRVVKDEGRLRLYPEES